MRLTAGPLAVGALVLIFRLLGAVVAQQDQPELSLSMRRDFGFRAGDRIQGRFTLEVFGPEDLVQVAFLLDGEIIGEAHERPFRFAFSTSQFSLGRHSLHATGVTVGGKILRSPERNFEFVAPEESLESAVGMALPLILGVAALATLGTVIPSLVGSRRPFRLGSYGAAGAAVCPRCALPYSRHVLALNLMGRRLERCPHCRKWTLVPRASGERLQAAEARYSEGERSPLTEGESAPERLRRMIDDSKYLE